MSKSLQIKLSTNKYKKQYRLEVFRHMEFWFPVTKTIIEDFNVDDFCKDHHPADAAVKILDPHIDDPQWFKKVNDFIEDSLNNM